MFVEMERNLTKPYPIILTAAGSTDTQTAIDRPDGFLFHHILWVTKGEGLFQLGEESIHLRAGYGVFIKKDFPHAYARSGAEFATSWVTFLGVDALLAFYQMKDYKVFPLPVFWQESCAQLQNLCEKGSTVAARSQACYTWLIELLESLEVTDTSVYTRVRNYLENNFDKPLTLDDIAAASGIDKFALCRYYAKERGISVMTHLKRVRITKAKQLLKFTACPIAEIGKLCGFESASYFGKIFREETKMTPRQYRSHG
mgnify:CR=1 FL=1